eukprot:1940895-Rhodomonas_salina.2
MSTEKKKRKGKRRGAETPYCQEHQGIHACNDEQKPVKPHAVRQQQDSNENTATYNTARDLEQSHVLKLFDIQA